MSRRSSSAPMSRTEASIKSHRAVSKMFAANAQQQKKITTDRLTGKTWSASSGSVVHTGLQGMYTPSQLHKLRLEGKAVDADGNIVDVGADGKGYDQSIKSCYLLNAQKQFHEYSGPEDPELRKLPLQNVRFSYTDALREYNKAQAIIRHERTIPKRRITDRYVDLTAAQRDLHPDVPSARSIRNRVRQHEPWVLSNSARQELIDGEPLMSRVMKGEYYYNDSDLNAPKRDFVRLNKQHVRSASCVSRVANGHAHVSVLPTATAAPQPRRLIATLKTFDGERERRLLAQRGRTQAADKAVTLDSAGATNQSQHQPQHYHHPEAAEPHHAYYDAYCDGAASCPPAGGGGGGGPAANGQRGGPAAVVGHRHYLPHSTAGITMGGRAAFEVIRPPVCDRYHTHERSQRAPPLEDGVDRFGASQTYYGEQWPPVEDLCPPDPTRPLHHSNPRHERRVSATTGLGLGFACSGGNKPDAPQHQHQYQYQQRRAMSSASSGRSSVGVGRSSYNATPHNYRMSRSSSLGGFR